MHPNERQVVLYSGDIYVYKSIWLNSDKIIGF